MKFEPLGDRVLVDPDPVEEKSAGGIILAQTETNKTPTVGMVVAVGAGRIAPDTGVLIPMSVTIGDVVTWGKFAGTHIEVGGLPRLLMHEADIAGILHPPAQVEEERHKNLPVVGPHGETHRDGHCDHCGHTPTKFKFMGGDGWPQWVCEGGCDATLVEAHYNKMKEAYDVKTK